MHKTRQREGCHQPMIKVDNMTDNIDKLQSDATLLMYELAVTAGNDEATNRVARRWLTTTDLDYFAYLAAGALTSMVRNVLAPVLDVAERSSEVDLRAGLREAYANAVVTPAVRGHSGLNIGG
jgi:hypothetical protein